MKLTPGMQQELRMDQLDPPDREAMLSRFSRGDFEIVLWGGLNAPIKDMVSNKLVLADKFFTLDADIDKKLKQKNGGQPAPPDQPAAQNDQPKGGLVDSVRGLLGGLKKKKE
jgi:hypothetical protein